MIPWRRSLIPAMLLLGGAGCASTDEAPFDPCAVGAGQGAISRCLAPRQTPEYYVEQGNRYFDALDVSAPAESVPLYAELAARWEWPPWLKLTGYGGEMMAELDAAVKKTEPSVVSHRDCRAFAVQPFARCRVSFDYEGMGDGKPCFIYEEFTFNDQGELTFIEAWSDVAELLPFDAAQDPWAEGESVHRLSTKVPGLGNATGRIDPSSPWMNEAAAADPEIADFVARTKDFWGKWLEASREAGGDYFQRGCGW